MNGDSVGQPMTPDQMAAFRERGCVLLSGALEKSRLEPLRKLVVDELKRLRIWSSGKTLSASIKKLPAFQQIAKLSGMINGGDLPARVLSPEINAVMEILAGARLAPAHSQLLVSLPNQGAWAIDGLNWHTDISPSAHHHVPGVQAFVLVDDVRPHGGATLAIAGSHRLAGRPEVEHKVRELLRGAGQLEAGLREHGLSIIEMSGRGGDVYLMDMRMLHTPSINSTGKVRMMVTVRCMSSEIKSIQ